jgi:DNA polymerase III subunit beta
MNLTLLQENLNRGLSITSRFVSSRTQLPILSNIALQTEKNRLKISATNLEVGVNYYCGAKIENEGGITVLSRTFSEFVSSLPAEKVVLVTKKESLKTICSNYQASFPVIPISDFPKVPTGVNQKITLSYSDFTRAIKNVVFAASSDDSRPILSGVHFNFINQECLLSATDGYRLSFRKIEMADKYPEEIEFIIPSVILNELLRLKPEGEQSIFELGLANKEKQAVFFLPNLEFSSRLLEGKYPDINKVIPEKKTTSILIEREELLGAVKTASIFARESANIIKLEIGNGKVRVLANAPSLGENISQVEAKIEGDNQRVAFNFHFLADLLSNLETDQVVIEMQESLKPVVFKNPKDKNFLHIIMPVKIQEEE